jgi:hypothetical protein
MRSSTRNSLGFSGLTGGGCGVNVVAVQAQTGLKAKGVTGAEARRLDLRDYGLGFRAQGLGFGLVGTRRKIPVPSVFERDRSAGIRD